MALAARLGALRAVLMARAAGDAQSYWLQARLLPERWPLEVTTQARQTVSSGEADDGPSSSLLARYQLARRDEPADDDRRLHQVLLSHAGEPVAPSGELHELMTEIASRNLLHPEQADELLRLERPSCATCSLPLDVLEQVLPLPPGR